MMNIKEVQGLTLTQIQLKINALAHAASQMVGTLYPNIVASEIDDLLFYAEHKYNEPWEIEAYKTFREHLWNWRKLPYRTIFIRVG